MQSNCALTSNLRYKTDVLVPLSFEGLITSLSKFATCAKSRENWQRLVLILDTKSPVNQCYFSHHSGPENNYGYAFNAGYGQQPNQLNDVSVSKFNH